MELRSVSKVSTFRQLLSIATCIALWNIEFRRLSFQVHSFKSTIGKRLTHLFKKIAFSRFFGRLILLFLPSITSPLMIDYPMAVTYLSSGKRKTVLDIGAGLSCFPSFLANYGYTVIGLDIQRDLVAENNLIVKKVRKGKLNGQIFFIVADAQYLPFKDGSIPQVISIGALQFVPNDNRASSEIARILTKDGVCAISVTYSPKPKNPGRFPDESVQRFYTDKDIFTRIVDPSGLKLESSYLFGKEISQLVYSALRIFRAPLRFPFSENPFIDVGLHFLEYLFKRQSKNANGIILKLCRI